MSHNTRNQNPAMNSTDVRLKNVWELTLTFYYHHHWERLISTTWNNLNKIYKNWNNDSCVWHAFASWRFYLGRNKVSLFNCRTVYCTFRSFITLSSSSETTRYQINTETVNWQHAKLTSRQSGIDRLSPMSCCLRRWKQSERSESVIKKLNV